MFIKGTRKKDIEQREQSCKAKYYFCPSYEVLKIDKKLEIFLSKFDNRKQKFS